MSNLEGKKTATKKTTKQNPKPNQTKQKQNKNHRQTENNCNKKVSKAVELERKIKRMREGEQFCLNP